MLSCHPRACVGFFTPVSYWVFAVDEIMTRNCNTHLRLQVVFLMIGDMTSCYDNLIFIAASGSANHELLSYQCLCWSGVSARLSNSQTTIQSA